jgi:hypothetical protein
VKWYEKPLALVFFLFLALLSLCLLFFLISFL